MAVQMKVLVPTAQVEALVTEMEKQGYELERFAEHHHIASSFWMLFRTAPHMTAEQVEQLAGEQDLSRIGEQEQADRNEIQTP
jgi:hypothetical protein